MYSKTRLRRFSVDTLVVIANPFILFNVLHVNDHSDNTLYVFNGYYHCSVGLVVVTIIRTHTLPCTCDNALRIPGKT